MRARSACAIIRSVARHGWGRGFAACAAVSTVAAGLAIVPAGPARAATLRPIPPPAHVDIGPSGYLPPATTLAVGQTVEFDNTATKAETVTADNGAFDSGPIPAGGAFSMAVGAAGSFSFHSADDALLVGSVTVGLQEIPGAPTDRAVADLPTISIPPMADLDVQPLGFGASRSRILVMLNPSATVADANALLAQINASVVGTIPELNAILVQLEVEPATGDFDPIDAALATLLASPIVSAATMDKLVSSSLVPPPSDGGGTTALNNYTFDDPRTPDGGTPSGTGGNWGLESSRFPSAWNALDPVRLKNTPVDTLVYDGAFQASNDLKILTPPLCDSNGGCTLNVAPADVTAHGTHVAGIIGATFDTTGTAPGTSLGTTGANPVAHLFGVPFAGGFQTNTRLFSTNSFQNLTSTAANWMLWQRMLDEKKVGGLWPNLRVINMSAKTVTFSQVAKVTQWGALNANRHCGPGAHDDDSSSTGPCTPNTDDKFLKDVANDGAFARVVAENAAAKNVLLTIASGNESTAICQNATTTANPVAGACPAGFTFTTVDTRNEHAFAWADANWQSGSNPIVMVDAVGQDNARAAFSDIGGDVSAPGVDIVSTVPAGSVPGFPGSYAPMSGTSMAAPFVAGLAGYLAAYNPSLQVGDIRNAIILGASHDTTGGAAARIDAYASLMRIPGSTRSLVDVNDASADGNRRVIYSRDGKTSTPDTSFGPSTPAGPVHSAPDGHVDMRDFRRFRDAQLEFCSQTFGVAGCPSATSITLDGAPDTPKKDLNFDGCVNFSTGTCSNEEEVWSRFDFNGDGLLKPNAFANVQLDGAGPANPLTDLGVLSSQFDEGTPSAEGWSRGSLPMLMQSADLEVHADPMFQAGAKSVSVDVQYGTSSTPTPARTIDTPGGSIIVTVPTPDSGGTPITIVGHATVDGKPLTSDLDIETLKSGADKRVDLCVPTLSVKTAEQAVADGASANNVDLVLNKCDDTQEPIAGQHVELTIQHAGDANAPTASLSTTTVDTDQDGHATVKLNVGDKTENDVISALASIGTGADAIEVHGNTTVDITEPPHVIYRWEQTNVSWNAQEHSHQSPDPAINDPGSDVTSTLTSIGPEVISRAGTLTPIGTTDAHLVENTPANTIDYHFVNVDTIGSNTRSGDASEVVPTGFRHHDVKLSDRITNFWQPNGTSTPSDQWTFGRTSFTTSDTKLSVHNFNDIANGVSSQYSFDPNTDCTGLDGPICSQEFELDQLALVQRLNGSAIEYAPDLTKDLTFGRLPNGTWSTYNYCGPKETLAMRGLPGPNILQEEISGTATIQVRFVATVVADNTDPSTLKFGDCSTPKPPIAAIVRAPITAKEGQLVHFVDASSDPNGDIVSWQWDFGDGATSTDQFPDHTYADNGTYTVTLTVTDATGNTDSTTVDEDVTNVAPQIITQDATVDTGQPAGVSFTAFDPGTRDAEALTLAITSDDPDVPKFPPVTVPAGSGTINIGILPDGPHAFTATLTDKDGATATSTFNVHTGDQTTGTVDPQDDIEVEPAPQCSYGVKLDLGESDLLDQISLYRLDNGLSPVYASPTLTHAAEDHLAYLSSNDLFSHTGSNNSSPFNRAHADGYPGTLVGENLVRGAANAPAALVAWKLSPSHNANLLNSKWNAVGIARVQTPQHGWLWVLDLGDAVDCPAIPPDLNFGNGNPLPVVISPPNPPIEVLGWSNARAAAASVTPFVPVVAFTISNRTPDAGAAVTITNRSTDPIAFDPGDGRPTIALDLGGSTNTDYIATGAVTASVSDGSLQAQLGVEVGGTATPPTITSDGPTAGGQHATVTLGAELVTGANAPVAGRTVDFTLGSLTTHGVTSAGGHVSAPITLELPAGSYVVQIDLPALTGGGNDATTSVPFAVTANAPPIAHAGGPYTSLIGDVLTLDGSHSIDPENHPLTASWDLNGDGTYGDATGLSVTLSGADAVTKICGGTCDTTRTYDLSLRVVDDQGAVSIDTTQITLRRDFGLEVSPANVSINPGGSTSLTVSVLSTSGFNQPVALSIPDVPPGVVAAFSPASVVPNGTARLTITAKQTAQTLNQNFTIRGTSGAIVHDATGTADVELGLVPQCFTSLDAHVVDDETNLPLAQAAVGGNFTDATGHVLITGLALQQGNAPTAVFEPVNHQGYFGQQPFPVVACGIVSTLEVRLVRIHTGTLVGHVYMGTPDPNDHRTTRKIVATSTPIPNASVTTDVGATTTDAAGRYELDNIPMFLPTNAPVAKIVQFGGTKYWTEGAVATIPPDTTTTLDFALVPVCTGTADVRVLDDTTHKPVAGALVSVSPGFGQNLLSGTTGADGVALVKNVPLGARNGSSAPQVSAALLVNGNYIFSQSGSISLFDCGSVGVTDLTLHTPVERHASMQGTVTDDGGAPVPDVQVWVGGETVITDAAGNYSAKNFSLGFDGPTTRDDTVVFAPTDGTHWALTTTAHLTDGQTTTLNAVVLRRRSGSADGFVRDAATGQPIAGVHVTVAGNASVLTDGDGHFHADGISVGPQNLPFDTVAAATLFGYWPETVNTTIVPDQTTSISINMLRMCAPLTVTGRVLNAATGAPLPGASVTGTGAAFPVLTDAGGRFALTGIQPFRNQPLGITVGASATGFFNGQRSITGFCGAHLVVDFGDDASGTGAVHGKVTKLSDGSALGGVTVGGDWGAVATTAPDGTYAFANVPIGAEPAAGWGVHVLAPLGSGLGDATKTVVVAANQNPTLDFALDAPHNHAPVADSQHLVFVPDPGSSVQSITLTGSDPDNDPITFRVTGATGGQVLTDTLPVARFLPNDPFTGGSFTFVATDGSLDSVPAEVTLSTSDTGSTTTTTTTTSTSTSTTTTSTSTTSTSTSSTSSTTVPRSTSTTTSTSTTSTTSPTPTSTTSTTIGEQGSTTSTTAPSTTSSATTPPPVTVVASGDGNGGSPLPFTGGDSRGSAAFAVTCLVLGAALAFRRRR